SGTASLYVDDRTESHRTVKSGGKIQTLEIGGHEKGTGLTGRIDEARFYNSSLTESEVKSLSFR
ncbi:MAG: hypothetical protein ABEK04_05670, partial [Candidatus Nanohalobium sp.]